MLIVFVMFIFLVVVVVVSEYLGILVWSALNLETQELSRTLLPIYQYFNYLYTCILNVKWRHITNRDIISIYTIYWHKHHINSFIKSFYFAYNAKCAHKCHVCVSTPVSMAPMKKRCRIMCQLTCHLNQLQSCFTCDMGICYVGRYDICTQNGCQTSTNWIQLPLLVPDKVYMQKKITVQSSSLSSL